MNAIAPFRGFPERAFSFFREIAANNSREWFEAHKQEYIDNVQSPAQSFVVALGERLRAVSPELTYDPRPHGGSIMRIYRDIRFTKDKSPYKAHLGINFWQGGKKSGKPGVHFYMDVTGGRLYAGMHQFSKGALSAYRKAVADKRLGADLDTALRSIESNPGFEIGGEQFKRVPRGYDPDHPRGDLLRYKGLYAMSPFIEIEQLGSPDVVDLCLDYAQALSPLNLWFDQAL